MRLKGCEVCLYYIYFRYFWALVDDEQILNIYHLFTFVKKNLINNCYYKVLPKYPCKAMSLEPHNILAQA